MASSDSRSPAPPSSSPPSLERVRALARLLDAAVRLPVVNVRVGLDAVFGLVPGAGDVVGALLSGSLVLTAARLGAPPILLLRMLLNLGVDALVGAVPVLGDVFDVGWKANLRNLRLLERHVEDPEGARRGSGLMVAGAGLGMLLVLTLLVAALWGATSLLLAPFAG